MRRAGVAGAVLAASVLVPGVPVAQATANPCSSRAHPVIARRLGKGILAALRGRTGTEAVAVFDRKNGITCLVNSARRYDSASVVKVTVLGALLRRAAERGRALTSQEKSLAHAMITRSDNGATSTLWRSLGRSRIQRFVRLTKMSQTKVGPGGYWGLTQITARDELRLLKVLTRHNRVLPDRSRAYALKLMSQVVSSQRWGVAAGAPSRTGVHLKNGWLPRYGRSWRVHSIGSFDGGGRDYMIVVLTQNAPSMTYGIGSIERVARTVHHTLNPGRRSMVAETTPPGPTWETSDGSVPELLGLP